MTDEYAYWRAALAANKTPILAADNPPIHEGDPQPGRYYKRNKDGTREPVAIWRVGDNMHAMIGSKIVDADEIWTWVADKPITQEVYDAVMRGAPWPDEPPPVKTSSALLDATNMTADEIAAGIRSHAAATSDHKPRPNIADDPAEALRIELEGEIETTAAFLAKPIASEDDANMAAAWAKRLTGLAGRATDAHKEEKEPWLVAGRVVDAKWFPIRDGATVLAAKLKEHLEPWLKAKKREAEAAQAAAQAEADRLRQEAAGARATAVDDVERRRAKELTEQAHQAQQAANVPAKAKAGRTGASVSLRTETRAVIVDYAACYAALASHPDMRAFVQTLADRACRAKHSLAGVEFREEEVAR